MTTRTVAACIRSFVSCPSQCIARQRCDSRLPLVRWHRYVAWPSNFYQARRAGRSGCSRANRTLVTTPSSVPLPKRVPHLEIREVASAKDRLACLDEQPLAPLDEDVCTALAKDLGQPLLLVAKFLTKCPEYQQRSPHVMAEKFRSIAAALELIVPQVLLMATHHRGLLLQAPGSLKAHVLELQLLLQLPERRVKVMLRTTPSLFGVRVDTIRRNVAAMQESLHLDSHQLRRMLCRRPALLQLSLSSMLLKVEMLAQMLGIKYTAACTLAARCPSLLYMSTSTLQDKVQALEAAFSGMSRDDVAAMLVARPSMLTASVEKLEQRWREVCEACTCSQLWQSQWAKYATSTRALILMKEQGAYARLRHLMAMQQYGAIPLSTLFTMPNASFKHRVCKT